MRFLAIASALGFLLLSGAAGAQQAPPDTQNIDNVVNIWVRLCVGGGHVEALSGGGTGGAAVSLRSLDVKGHLTGEVTVSKSSAEGLVKGIDNAMSQIAAAEADKVRVCLQPVRERLLDIMLPAPKAAAPQNGIPGALVATPQDGFVFTLNRCEKAQAAAVDCSFSVVNQGADRALSICVPCGGSYVIGSDGINLALRALQIGGQPGGILTASGVPVKGDDEFWRGRAGC